MSTLLAKKPTHSLFLLLSCAACAGKPESLTTASLKILNSKIASLAKSQNELKPLLQEIGQTFQEKNLPVHPLINQAFLLLEQGFDTYGNHFPSTPSQSTSKTSPNQTAAFSQKASPPNSAFLLNLNHNLLSLLTPFSSSQNLLNLASAETSALNEMVFSPSDMAARFCQQLKNNCSSGRFNLFWRKMNSEKSFYVPDHEENTPYLFYKNYKATKDPFLQRVLTEGGSQHKGFRSVPQNSPIVLRISSQASQEMRNSFPNWKKSLQESLMPLMVEDIAFLHEKEILPQIVRCHINLTPGQPIDFSAVASTIKENNIQVSLSLSHAHAESPSDTWFQGIRKIFETGQVSELIVATESFTAGGHNWKELTEHQSHLDKLRSFSYDMNVVCRDFCELVQFLAIRTPNISKFSFSGMRIDPFFSWTRERIAALPACFHNLKEVSIGDGFSTSGEILLEIMKLFPQKLPYLSTQGDRYAYAERLISPFFMEKIANQFHNLLECNLIADPLGVKGLCQALLKHQNLKRFGLVLRSEKEIDLLSKEIKNFKHLETFDLYIAKPHLWDWKLSGKLIHAFGQISSFKTLVLFPKEDSVLDKVYIRDFIKIVILPFLSALPAETKIDLAFRPYLNCFQEIQELIQNQPDLQNRLLICGTTLDHICAAGKKLMEKKYP
jgi:hypothetical protein